MIALGRPPAPLWEHVYDLLPSVLPVTRIDRDLGQLEGEFGRARVSHRAAVPLAADVGDRPDRGPLEVLARVAQLPRAQVLPALRQDYERSAPLPAVIQGRGCPYGHVSAEAVAYAGGRL